MTTKSFPPSVNSGFRRIKIFLLLLAAAGGMSAASSAAAAAPRVLPSGETPRDIRLQPLKDLDGYFPFTPPKNPEEWERRSERVRLQLLVSQGLWPMPDATPLNPVIHGKIDRGDYTVEKVYFEANPGFYVTGNLYRPKGHSGKRAAVLSPHGHWAQGRFYDQGMEAARREIEKGAERFEEGGRSPLQARCVQLARMGVVVFHYDMTGYADSAQISEDLAHRFARQRPEMNAPVNWGLYSPQAESHLQTVMGLQTYSTMRAYECLAELPDVDADRIGVTGASGGGTQTFILCALDHRPAVSFPAVMVSTSMQGGCTCENASLLRVGTGNIEFAAMYAPKPQGLTAAEDWTREMETKGFPELKEHYRMLGAPENVMLLARLEFGHNYNVVSREAMYHWFNRHLKLGVPEPIQERDYQRLSREEMTVWNQEHSKPEGGPEFERDLLRRLTEESSKKLAEARQSRENYGNLAGKGVAMILGRNIEETGPVEFELKQKNERRGYIEMGGLLRNVEHAEELPALFLYPGNWNGETVIWVDVLGKAGLFQTADGGGELELKPEVKKLVEAGTTVVGVDLLFQGEFLADGELVTQTRRVRNPREFAGYTFGYNYALFAQRVHDVLTVVRFVKDHERPSKAIHLVGLGGAGSWVAAARTQAGSAVDRAAVETGGFRFGAVTDLHDVNFLPGGAKYDDLPGMLALNAPGKLWVSGETEEGAKLVNGLYQRSGAEGNLTLDRGNGEQVRARAVAWLLER